VSRGTVEALRTPSEQFVGLPDFPHDAHYREVDGLRLAHLDEGEGPPVLLGTLRPEGLGSFESSPKARSRGPR
jgi:hypothetical protein